MKQPPPNTPDHSLDLVLMRVINVPKELVWQAWTTPELLKKWFCPVPWKTTHCEIDLRPGGIFRTVMNGPEGEEFDGVGCFLEVVENAKLVWTSALGPGFRPYPVTDDAGNGIFRFTVTITLEDHALGTTYTARVTHADEAGRRQHEEMGFHEGWGKALDQLVELVRK